LIGAWAIETQKELQKQFPGEDNHILIPLLLYCDGVSVGWGSNVTFENATISLGNFPADLTRSMLGKMNIGFTSSVSKKDLHHTTLSRHLEEIFGTKTQAENEVNSVFILFKDITMMLINIDNCFQ
jgi:hypothetical protein